MLFAVFVFAVLFLLFMFKSAKRPKNFPPGPIRIPFIGSFLSVDATRPSRTFKKWADVYGDIYSVKLGGQDYVILTDPDLIKEAMQNSLDFINRPDTFNWKFYVDFRNAGLSGSWGSVWKEQRRFSIRHLRDFGFGKSSMEDIVKAEIREQIQRLNDKVGEPLELSWDFNIAITNIIWSITAGVRFDVDSPKMQSFHSALREFFNFSTTLMIVDFFPFLLHIMPNSVFKVDRAKEIVDLLRNYFKEEVENHKKTFSMEGKDRDLVDAYLRKIEEESSNPGFDREEQEFNLLTIMHDLFTAGGETTYTTLRWAFTYLVKYPNIQKRIQKDLDEVVGTSRMPTYEDRISLPYLEAFIMEVQRLSALIPLSVPHAAVRNSVIGGYNIPKGTQVLAHVCGLHLSNKYWGDPEVFRPERFLDDNKNIIKNNAFIPFGFGRRQCLGEPLAKMELFLFISCLLQQLNFDAVDNPKDITLDSENESLVRYPSRYKMVVTRRLKIEEE